MLLNGVLQAEQVLPGRRKGDDVVCNGDALIECGCRVSFSTRCQTPRAVAGRLILDERPRARRSLESALRPDVDIDRAP